MVLFKTVAIIVPNNGLIAGGIKIFSALRLLLGSLKSMGYDIKKVAFVKEEDSVLAQELTILTKLYDLVIIVAKLKPVYVSKALGSMTMQEIEYSPSESELKWPKSVKILHSDHSDTPGVIYFQRIFVLQLGAIKEQVQHILTNHLQHYRKENTYSKSFYIPKNGVRSHIQTLQVENVNIQYEEATDCDVITLSSGDFEKIVNAEVLLRQEINTTILNCHWRNEMKDLIYQSDDNHIKLSIEVIEKCLDKYGLENVFLSFNGGKDCTVLLHLIKTIIEKRYPEKWSDVKLCCLYVRSKNAFKDQDEFIEQCRVFFNLEVITVNANIKDALQTILDQKPHFKAVFMGTRRTDPYSNHLNVMQVTDPGWPQVMRCNPLLDWNYSDIWDYLLYYKVPYCKLYDYGYTSLGDTLNTIRNPILQYDEGSKDSYLPAYKMMIDKSERSGRNVSKI